MLERNNWWANLIPGNNWWTNLIARFVDNVIHQEKYMQQQFNSGALPMALSIYSSQRHSMHQKGKHLP